MIRPDWPDECPDDEPDWELIDRQQRTIAALGLTDQEKQALIGCYSSGYSEREVADAVGVSRDVIKRNLLSACDKVVAAGYPRPRPYGRGSREELRRAFPQLVRLT